MSRPFFRVALSFLLLVALTWIAWARLPMNVSEIDPDRVFKDTEYYDLVAEKKLLANKKYLKELLIDPKAEVQPDKVELQAAYDAKVSDWKKRWSDYVERRRGDIITAIEAVAKQRGADMVVMRPKAAQIFYLSGEDLTSDVLLKIEETL